VANLLAEGYSVAADPSSVLQADVLLGEDGRVHAVRLPANRMLKGSEIEAMRRLAWLFLAAGLYAQTPQFEAASMKALPRGEPNRPRTADAARGFETRPPGDANRLPPHV